MGHFIRKDFTEILTVEIFAVIGGLAAGTMLAFYAGQIVLIPGILILIPGFLEMRGNISGTLSSRLTSGLYINAVKPHIKKNRILKGNVYAAILLVLVVAFCLGLVATLASYLILGLPDFRLIFIPVIAALISNAIEIPLTVATTFWLFRNGHDPNNIMGPYVTTMGDIVSTIALLIAIFLVI